MVSGKGRGNEIEMQYVCEGDGDAREAAPRYRGVGGTEVLEAAGAAAPAREREGLLWKRTGSWRDASKRFNGWRRLQ